ncbi:MAG: hypothetical protein WA885_12600 [Phormidesmis sp.]
MEPQTVTLHLPDATYRRLVELSTKSERPLPEETVHLLTSALASNEALASDITARLEHLFLLTDEELWNAATSTASDEDNELMQGLLEKRQRAGLTSNESEQLHVLSAHFNQIMMTRAKSAAILLERGHDISALAPQ